MELQKGDSVKATNTYGKQITGTVLSVRGNTVSILTVVGNCNRAQQWHISKVRRIIA